MWLIELGFRNYFILKHYRFLTTAIFICSASTVHKSFKVVDSCWTFSTELSDTFRSCFVYVKEQES